MTATQLVPGSAVSDPSAPVSFTVDTVAPAVPVITSPADGTTINDSTPPITGTGTPGDTVSVTDANNSPVCGPVTVDGAVAWTCTPGTALPEGPNTITATETDPAGNTTPSAPVTFTVDTVVVVAPPVITSPADGSTVNNGTVAFTGTGIAGDTVTVTENGQALCSAVVRADGSWNCTPTAGLSVGPHTVVSTQKDPVSGVVSGPSNIVTFTTAIVGTQYVPKTPYRVLDTRPSTQVGPTVGPVALGGTVKLSAAQLKVPAGSASAVVLNLTVDDPAEAGFVTAYPSDQPLPTVSSLNFAKGQTRANLVIVPVAADGSVTLYAQQQTQLVADVFGYFATQLVTQSGGLFHPLTPSRLLDTRLGGNTPLATNETRNLPVTGRGGVPSTGVDAVVLNVTVSRPTGAGYVSAFPGGTSFNRTSNVNFEPGDLASTRVIVPVGADGSVSFYNFNGNTQLVVDVSGWFSADGSGDTSGAQFVAVDPNRVVDSRPPSVGTNGALGAGETRTLQLTGGVNVPTADTVAVVSNVTAVNPTVPGFFTQYPVGGPLPLASDVNFVADEVVANLALSGVNASGSASLYNLAGRTDVVEDVSGYFRAPSTP